MMGWNEITQKRIACSEGQKCERAAFGGRICGKRENSVDDLVRSAIAADRDELVIALCLRFARKPRRIAGRVGLSHFELHTRRAQTLDRSWREFGATSASRRWIHDSEEFPGHVRFSHRNQI